MRALFFLFILTLIACGSPERELTTTIDLVTDAPPSLFSHWNGKQGLLARFGTGSEVGAIMHYSYKQTRSFVIFDETGKRFINDSAGKLTGPFPVKDLFRQKEIKFWGLEDTSVTNLFALSIEKHGVESAVYSGTSGLENTNSMTVVTKDGIQHVLIKDIDGVKIKDKDYGIIAHTYLEGPLEAILYDSRIGGDYPAIVSDQFGLSFVDGNNNNLGKTHDIWDKIPSSKIEAMCYYAELGATNNNTHTTILFLGEEGHVKNGQFVYFIMDNGIDSTTKLVDLRKDYN